MAKPDDELFALTAGRPAWNEQQACFVQHSRHRYPQMAERRGKGEMSLKRRHIDKARDYNRIELNNHKNRNFLAVDLDGSGSDPCADAIRRLELSPVPPHIIVPTPHGAHGIWAIDGTRKGTRADEFAIDCQKNLTRLLGGDPDYSAHTVANPLCLSLRPVFLTDLAQPYGLRTIKEMIGTDWKSPPPFLPRGGDAGEGRNADLYRQGRDLLRHGTPPETLQDELMMLNEAYPVPLTVSEVRSIAKSLLKPQRRNEYRSRMGRKGGQAKTEAKLKAARATLLRVNEARAEAAGERIDRILTVHTGLSVAEIAETEQVSVRTIQRDLQMLRRTELR